MNREPEDRGPENHEHQPNVPAQRNQNDEADARREDIETLDEPVLEGAEEVIEEDIDPRKGQSDPALIRDVESGKKTVNPYG